MSKVEIKKYENDFEVTITIIDPTTEQIVDSYSRVGRYKNRKIFIRRGVEARCRLRNVSKKDTLQILSELANQLKILGWETDPPRKPDTSCLGFCS